MSRFDEVEQLFKKLDVFPKIEEVARLANRVCATVHDLEHQLEQQLKELSHTKQKLKLSRQTAKNAIHEIGEKDKIIATLRHNNKQLKEQG